MIRPDRIYGMRVGNGLVAVMVLEVQPYKWARVRAFNATREEWRPAETVPKAQLLELQPGNPQLRVAMRYRIRLTQGEAVA